MNNQVIDVDDILFAGSPMRGFTLSTWFQMFEVCCKVSAGARLRLWKLHFSFK